MLRGRYEEPRSSHPQIQRSATLRYGCQLVDIARMVRDGSDIRVVDGRTGKDVTHIILKSLPKTPRSVRLLCRLNS